MIGSEWCSRPATDQTLREHRFGICIMKDISTLSSGADDRSVPSVACRVARRSELSARKVSCVVYLVSYFLFTLISVLARRRFITFLILMPFPYLRMDVAS
jgi:hypothetical protein